MILPVGITGFFDGERDFIPPTVDLKMFAGACHEAARASRGSVKKLELEPDGIAHNFHRAILQLREDPVVVLCNAHYPWIAFAKAGDDLELRFTENLPLESLFRNAMPCEVVSLSWLETHPDAGLLANLNDIEYKQIRYWRPRRLGDIIFNFWD